MNLTWILDKIFGVRSFLILLGILIATITLVYFKPLTLRYSQCEVSDTGYTVIGHEYRLRTVVSTETGGAVLCVKQIETRRTHQNNLVEKRAPVPPA
jgi:hypothetical protein